MKASYEIHISSVPGAKAIRIRTNMTNHWSAATLGPVSTWMGDCLQSVRTQSWTIASKQSKGMFFCNFGCLHVDMYHQTIVQAAIAARTCANTTDHWSGEKLGQVSTWMGDPLQKDPNLNKGQEKFSSIYFNEMCQSTGQKSSNITQTYCFSGQRHVCLLVSSCIS